MSLTPDQTTALAAKLQIKHVRARRDGDTTRHYIEGWHVISEANRIFGYDGWDRETLETRCLWQGARRNRPCCLYSAKVRITVHAGPRRIIRDGHGTGEGEGADPGEAHEKALKAAETDATKRALVTFGNPFGLALYDTEREGLSRRCSSRRRRGLTWQLNLAHSTKRFDDPVDLCSQLRQAIEAAETTENLERLWAANHATLDRLRLIAPGLTDQQGRHFADLLERLIAERRRHLRQPDFDRTHADSDVPADPTPTDHSAPAHPRRVRDKSQLAFVARQPCLVCGRTPVQAHHLTFIQPKAMSRKSGDQWTVPLCALHHRALHDAGDERGWWRQQQIDAENAAQQLWQEHLNAGSSSAA